MASWHQQRRPVPLYHATQWTVVTDPPNQMCTLMTFSARDLADVYMRNLRENNPRAAEHSYILSPYKPKGTDHDKH